MLLLFRLCLFHCFCVVALVAFHRCSLRLLPVSFSHKSLHTSHLYFIVSWWTKMASTLGCLMETRSLNSLQSAHTHTHTCTEFGVSLFWGGIHGAPIFGAGQNTLLGPKSAAVVPSTSCRIWNSAEGFLYHRFQSGMFVARCQTMIDYKPSVTD